MLSPRDLLTIPVTGDDDVGDTYSDQPGETQDQGKAGYSLGRDHRRQHGVLPRGSSTGQLLANAQNVYQTEYVPDAWLVMIPFLAGVNVELSMGEGAALMPLARFGPGGYARIIGIAERITLTNISSTPCYPVVVALAYCGELTAADVQIFPGFGAQAK